MSRVEDYLAISEGYCRWLGDLRWCPGGEAVEHACEGPEIGMTFAMAPEIALFLEGFQASAPPICFSFVLHLLHMLGLGARIPRPESPRRVEGLEKAFRESGLPFRNAGALCAMLCRGVPREPGAPPLADVRLALNRPSSDPFGEPRTSRRAVVPPLEPAEFEARVLDALARLTPQEVRHWLRNGRGPIGSAGDRLVQELPTSLASALESLARRPRLAGSGPLVARLSGLLTLPPRRLAASELPTGGYSDVATRGLPEQILPIQLALEGDEFVRRFAQNELLYFHREEPRARVSEEMVVVLDQGVRTWGDVRLVLAAGVLALGRHAGRRKVPFRIAATSHGGALLDPLRVDGEELGAILEASDLTPHPGLLLERVLELPGEAAFRDVILLTHPRSLREADVAAAARRAAAGTRLFSITVDAAGQVELAELRRGVPVVRGRCRVDVAGQAPEVTVTRQEAATGSATWLGDVETPPFPFRLGALSPIPEHLFDFDESGDWIVFAGQHGLLHAWRTDGSSVEMLPRGVLDGRPVSWVGAVVGVSGGFAVAGRNGKDEVVAHYDFPARSCRVYRLSGPSSHAREWSYVRELHALVARVGDGPVLALGLADDGGTACYPPGPANGAASMRAEWAYRMAEGSLVPQGLSLRGSGPSRGDGRSLRLHPETGALELVEDEGACRTITPTTDGRPALVGCTIRKTRFGDNVAAAIIGDHARASLYFFSLGSFRVIGECPLRSDLSGFALSRDGRRFARKAADRHLEVREVSGGSAPLAASPKGKSHQRLDVELGESFLTIHNGKFTHLVRWDRRIVEFSLGGDGVRSLLAREFWGATPRRVAAARGRGAVGVDPRRFIASCALGGLTLLVDFLGQVSVLGPSSELIGMFYVFRDQVAAWMPDGTRMGPASLTGGPPTPGAAGRFAAALAAGSTAGGSVLK